MGIIAKNHEWGLLNYGPILVERDIKNYINIMIWCQSELTGRFRDTAAMSNDNMSVSYYFENSDDALLFKLTWDTKSY